MASVPDPPLTPPDSNSGFAMIPTWLLRDHRFSRNAKMVYALLTPYARESGVAFPSQQTLADQLGCSTDTIQRALVQLNEAGLVVTTVERHAGGRRNRYHLMVDRRGDDRTDAVTHDRTSDVTPGGVTAPVLPPMTAPVRQEVDAVEVEEDRTSLVEADVDAWFDEWWDNYPKKVGKVAARTAYARALVRRVPTGIILEGLTHQLPAMRAKIDAGEGQYIPNPATWLNQGRWTDRPLPPPRKSREQRLQEEGYT